MKHFDRLYNIVIEDINSSKVSRRHHIVSEGKCSELRKLHCITVGQAKAQLTKLDPSTPLKALSLEQNGKIWDEGVIMGFEDWSDDYAVIDRDSYDTKVMTAGELLNKLQNIPDNRFFACLAFATYAHTPDYVKEIQPDGTVIVDMAWFPYNGEEGAPCRLDLQSVKVDKSKKVIKEERMSEERREELYELALNLYENYEWSSEEAQEAFYEDYPSFRRDFIDDYINSPISDEEFAEDFIGTMAYYNSNQYLEESKKVDKRRKVIKESAKRPVRRHARRHLIKEWSYDDFVRVNKDRMNKILDRILSQYRDLYKQELMNRVENDMKRSVHQDDPADPDETAAYVLEKYEYIFRQSKKLYNLLTDEEKVNFEKYCDRFLEGMEGYVYDMYGGGSGYYEEVCAMDPVYKEIVDEIVQENGGPIEESVKKPVSKRRLIKEHRAHKPSRRRVIKESKAHWIDYSEQAAKQWFKKVEENKKVIPLVLQKNSNRVEGIAKLYNTVKDIDEWMDESECEMSTNEWWEKLGLYVDPYLLQDTTGLPEFDDNCWYDRADDYSYQVKNYIEEYILPEYTKEQMKKFAEITGYQYDDMDYESKKVDRRRRVIKEHRAHRPSRRKVIKEDRLTQDQWLDMLQEKFDGVVKGLLEKYPNDVISSIDTSYFSSDPEDNACQILDGLFVDLLDRFPQNLLTERDKKWIGKYSAQWEGCEGLWSDYGWGGHDVGAYKDLRAKFPILADFVDKYVKEHPYEGTNAKYHYTDPRAKNPPFPTKAPVAESVKKPVSRRRVIKESTRRPVKRHIRRQIKK